MHDSKFISTRPCVIQQYMISFNERNGTINEEMENLDLRAATSESTYPHTHAHIHTCYLPVSPLKKLARHFLCQSLFYLTNAFAFIDVFQGPTPKYQVMKYYRSCASKVTHIVSLEIKRKLVALTLRLFRPPYSMCRMLVGHNFSQESDPVFHPVATL